MKSDEIKWTQVGAIDDFPHDGGMCVQVNGQQIAVYRFSQRNEWFATDNLCPHKQQMALARGMLGSYGDACEPKVACPFHKKTYSLLDGRCLSGDDYQIATYPVVVDEGAVFVGVSG